jgi:hypothetical protein
VRKIPTLFLRDPATNMRTLTREVHPECQWVLDGEGTPTRKFDGTCVMLDTDGGWWARREVKPGKPAPAGFVQEDFDPETGKTVGWEPLGQSAFARWHEQAESQTDPGTYELCGPKVNGNPEGFTAHVLVRHGREVLQEVPRDYDGLEKWLGESDFEGIVWHHPDGRMAKIKKRDFGQAR